MSKEDQIMDFLNEKIFDPILNSPTAPREIKEGTQRTIDYLRQRDAQGMIDYYWACIIGSNRSIEFSRKMRAAGFPRFEDIIEEFRDRFNAEWLKS